MKRFYITTFFLIALFLSQKTTAQIACDAAFSLNLAASTPFNAVIVNSSTFTPGLTPPDSGLYYWSWGDGTSSMAKYPTHTYTSPGAKSIRLFITNVGKSCGDSVIHVITIDSLGGFHKNNAGYNITVVAPGSTGIKSVKTKEFVSITPSIVKNNATLNFNGLNNDATVNVDIYSCDGKNVMSVTEKLNSNSLQLQTNALPRGMYFTVVASGGKTTVIKFIKQ